MLQTNIHISRQSIRYKIIKQTITEETTALPQIPVKTRQKSGTYRTKCRAIFRSQVYRFRNQVEGVNSAEKRKFSE